MNASLMHMNTMDEVILRVLSGEAEPIDERRLANWRAEAAQNDEHFEEVSTIRSEPLRYPVGVPLTRAHDCLSLDHRSPRR